MPRTISALRSARVSEVKYQRNRSTRAAVKTYIGNAEAAIASGDNEKARQAVKEAITKVDLAVKRGIMHDNTGARRKSLLMKKINKAFGPQVLTAEAKKPAKKATRRKSAKKTEEPAAE